jgi:hypothetical protein
MKRAMARQAEAERERRAKIIVSEGELQAAEKLTQAAQMISSQPAALQLRTLQTLVEVSAERNNTIIFPIPIELMPRPGEAPAPVLGNVVTAAATALAAGKANQAAQLPSRQPSSTDIDRLKAQFEELMEEAKKGT